VRPEIVRYELEKWRASKMRPDFAVQCIFAEALWSEREVKRDLLEALKEIRSTLSSSQRGYMAICDRVIAKAEGL
jgi:hypothetical protein